MTVDELVDLLEAARQETLRRFSDLAPERVLEERTWLGRKSNLRFLLYWLSEGNESRRVRIVDTAQRLGHRNTVAQRVSIILGEMRGRLLGALVGVSDQLFERAPSEGEWSIRRILGHVIATDERYGIAVQYAVDRARRGGEGPLRPPESSLPPASGEAQSEGTRTEILERLCQVRRTVARELALVPDDLLASPTNWAGWELDVRFRLHRFASHDREHTSQIRKTLQALGLQQTEPQLLLADAMAELGALTATLTSAGDGILNQTPPDGPTIAAIVHECLDEERALS